MSCEFSEKDIIQELQNLMKNERIQPEPEFECFAKYFASGQCNEFLSDNEIFSLINSQEIHLRNEVKYWLDRKIEENGNNKEGNQQVPVVNPKHFEFLDFDDVIQKLKEMPVEWTILQITKKFSKFDITRKTDNQKAPGIHIIRFSCGKDAEKIPPYCVTIDHSSNSVENIFEIPKNLAKLRREYFSMGRTSKKLYDAYYNTNAELMGFIKELELCILRHWTCLFHGKMEDVNLEKETLKQVKTLIASLLKKENLKIRPSEKQINIIYLATLSAHILKNKELFTILREMLFGNECDCIKGSELMLLVENLKLLNLSKECAVKRAKYNPVILILDSDFENVPWEMISPLLGQPVCRMSSLHMLYSLYKYHESYIDNGFRIVKVDCVYSLINPGKDLDSCEKQMRKFLKKRIPWAETEIGNVPDPKDLISKIENYSAYLYCGHGSGMQYLKGKDLKKAFVSGLILLFGCSSNVPRNCGGRTPHQNNTYTYIINGCPCMIGCMQDVGSTDADAACEDMLSKFMPYLEYDGPKVKMAEPKEPNVLRALAEAKSVCLKFWSKSAFVARGIPCKTTVGDVTKIINKLP